MAKMWIQMVLKKSKKRSLRRSLGVKKGQAIPLKRLWAAAKKQGELWGRPAPENG